MSGLDTLMSRMGIKQNQIKGVSEVRILFPDETLIFKSPVVVKIIYQGRESYQVYADKPEVMQNESRDKGSE